jgi:hypothetical protein
VRLRDGSEVADPRLDRLEEFDKRSRGYPVRALLGTRKPRSYTWRIKTTGVLDQGREGACVGFAWAAELAARPVEVTGVDDAFALAIYHRAQQLDEWPGEAPAYHGTSVLAGAKACQEQGRISQYRWAFGLDDVLDTLGYLGPVVLGVNWHESMYRPDANGYIRPTGPIVGGHAILARAVNVRERYVTLRNSWGAGYGLGGDCRITFDDLGGLLAARGEACVPIVR